MAYRTANEARQFIAARRLDVREGRTDCVLVRDNYGNSRGFIHKGFCIAYFCKRDRLHVKTLDVIINGNGGKTKEGRRNLITYIRSMRIHGDHRLIVPVEEWENQGFA